MRMVNVGSGAKLRKMVVGALGAVLLSSGLLTVVASAPASAAGGLSVFVGYADTLRASAANFPTPWGAGPSTVFIGSGNPLDAGAVRLVNNNSSPVSVLATSVDLHHGAGGASGPVFNPWGGFTIPANGQAILTQTTQYNFDTSDFAIEPCGTTVPASDPRIPTVAITTATGTTTLQDSGHVLDTKGYDLACQGNESTQWTQIGSDPCPSATLTLAPASQTHSVGQTATVTATLANSCGQPLQGAVVDFAVASGPNSGLSGPGTGPTDANGMTSFTYSSSLTGTDTLFAGTQNPAGTIFSNTVTVTWVLPVTMTGRAFGIAATGLVKIPPTPDTGFVSTPAASTTTTPCVLSVPAVIVVAHVLCANVTTALKPAGSTAAASTADATVAIPGAPLVVVGVTRALSNTTCAGSQGLTTIAALKIGTTPIVLPSTVPANDKIVNIPGVLTIILNEQISGPGTLTVNAVHIIVLGTVENVVISSATSDIHNCPLT